MARTRIPVIRVLRGLDENLPGLRLAEPAFTTDHHNLYVGIDSTTENNKFLGSHRYWRKEDSGFSSQLKLVPGVPGTSSQYLALQVPDNGFAGINTYMFPTYNSGSANDVLSLDSISGGVYTLSWKPAGPDFTEINVTGDVLVGGGLTVGGNVSFNGSVTGTISTATRSTTVDTTLTTVNGEYYLTFVDTAASSTGETLRVDSDGLTYNPSTNTLTVPTIDLSEIRSSNDVVAITIDASGNVSATQNLRVQGNLIVNGDTTQINTTELQVEDRSITLGIETSSTPLTTTWDLGILMNYGDAGVAKTAGIIWDYSNERMVISANSDNPASDQGTSNTPIFTVSEYAPIEVNSLWINDIQGQDEVISSLDDDTNYNGQPAGRYLQNVDIDAGEY
jgi:hypothetical protein